MQPPRFTTRGLLLMTALIGAACGCFGAVMQVEPVLAAGLGALGLFCIGAAFGVLFGRPFHYGVVLIGLTVWLAILAFLTLAVIIAVYR